MGKKMKKLAGICLGTAATWSFAVMPRVWNKPDLSEIKRYDYANRGYRGIDNKVPENSLAAYRAAIEHGYGILADVRITRDGVPVLFADSRLERMTGGNGTIENSTIEEIRALTLNGSEEKIPTLEEALQLIDGQVPVVLDLRVESDNYYSLCDQVCEVLDVYEGVFAVQSTDPRVLGWYKKQRNEYIRGQKVDYAHKSGSEIQNILWDFLCSSLLLNFLVAPDFVSSGITQRINPSLILCRLIYRIPRMNWTVRTMDEYEKVRTDGAMAVFEDIEL